MTYSPRVVPKAISSARYRTGRSARTRVLPDSAWLPIPSYLAPTPLKFSLPFPPFLLYKFPFLLYRVKERCGLRRYNGRFEVT